MHNPINYEFCSGDTKKGDYIGYLTNYSYIIILNLESIKAVYTKSKELRLFIIFLLKL